MTRPPWTIRTDFSEAPIFVCWEATKACLLSCRHCRAKAIKNVQPGELDTHDGLKIIDQLIEFGEPYPALLLTGGDPLMRSDFFELVEYAKRKGIYVAVAVSVTPRLNEDSISHMRDSGVDIMSVSLDGASPETHDRIRGIQGTWKATIDALRLARDLGLRTQANTTVMQSNITQLADIFHIAKESGAVAWEVFFLIRTGRGASLESLNASESEEVMNFLYEAALYGTPVRTAEGPSFRRVRMQRQNKESTPLSGHLYSKLSDRLYELEGIPSDSPKFKLTHTSDGRGIMFVSHTGEVYPSGFLPINCGKVPDQKLRTIYRMNSIFAALKDPSNLKGRCGACEFNTVCGGSRSRAYAELNDPFEEDPICPYDPSRTQASNNSQAIITNEKVKQV